MLPLLDCFLGVDFLDDFDDLDDLPFDLVDLADLVAVFFLDVFFAEPDDLLAVLVLLETILLTIFYFGLDADLAFKPALLVAVFFDVFLAVVLVVFLIAFDLLDFLVAVFFFEAVVLLFVAPLVFEDLVRTATQWLVYCVIVKRLQQSLTELRLSLIHI